MIVFIAFNFILIACFSLYLVSKKQIAKTIKSRWAILAKQVKIVRFIAILLILIAFGCFSHYFGNSIAVVALCIFSTPVIFAIILLVNDLKPKN